MTPYCHIHKKAIGPNRNYYRIYFDFIPRLIQITRTVSYTHLTLPTKLEV